MSDDAGAFRLEVRGCIAEHWGTAMTVRSWWELLVEAGLQFPTWPTGLGGRGLPAATARIVHEELAGAGALGPPFNVGTLMGAEVIIAHGTVEQQRRFLPPLARGLEWWCQMFSEPGAGSDLAGLSTRAERDGDRWRVTGQKVWSSGAHQADRAMLLARTDPDVPKHKGLGWFVLDVDQPGVEIRPIRQMNGIAGHFNEVFLDGAVVEDACLVGGPGGGWAAALTTLEHERISLNVRQRGLVWGSPGTRAGQLERRAADVVADGDQASEYVANRRFVNAAALRRSAEGRWDDRLRRDDLVRLHTLDQLIDWTARRATQAPGTVRAAPNLAKVAKSDQARLAQQLAGDVHGAAATLFGPDAPEDGLITHMMTTTPSFSIAGGTDQVQRNIIGERGLGLPREPAPLTPGR